MAKITNRRPGQVLTTTKKDVAMAMKRRDHNLNHTKFTKIILLLMVLAFVLPYIVQLIVNLFYQ